MTIPSESKLFVAIAAATGILVAVAAWVFSRPPATIPQSTLVPTTAHTIGNPSAKTVLVEFSDFQCPACRSFQSVVNEIIENNKGNLLFAYRHFPLDQHAFAVKAALAAEKAGEQGKFWEMSTLLFANQDVFSDTRFIELSQELKLDLKTFSDKQHDKKLTDQILADRAVGISLGINATPTFFLNGQKLILTSYQDLKDAVDEKIKEAQNK